MTDQWKAHGRRLSSGPSGDNVIPLPSTEQSADFGALCGCAVRITGRQLNAKFRPNIRLYDAILRRRVPWKA